MSERRFPVMGGPSVPWSFVEPFAEQAYVNHGQTLERLAQRGGLDPSELWCIAHGKRWNDRAPNEVCDAWLHEQASLVASLSAQLATAIAERDAAVERVRDVADDLLGMQELAGHDELLSRISKQAHEWRIRLANVQLRLDAAAVPDDPTAVTWRRESSRVDDLARDLDEHKAELERVRELASERREALEYAADQTAEQIAAWLDAWAESHGDIGAHDEIREKAAELRAGLWRTTSGKGAGR